MLRPWEFNMDIVRNNGTAIHMQIAHNIVAQIEQGYLLPGVALPGSREFSQKLKVNRKTVIQAYDELIAQGWLTAQYKRGTFVSSQSVKKKSAELHPTFSNEHAQHAYPSTNHLETVSQIHSFLSATNQHDLVRNSLVRSSTLTEFINFGVDLPDERLASLKAISSALRHALSINEKNYSLHDDNPLGTTGLRQAILQMVNMERNLRAQLAQTCVAHSGKTAIFLATRAIVQTGDIVLVDELACQSTRATFKNLDAVVLELKHNSQGIDLVTLNTLCLQHKVCAVYVKPRCHIATGIGMSLEHKKQLLDLSNKFNFMIIEDDQDVEFDDRQQASFPIASLEQQQQVIYIGSFSKILPSLISTAYIIASSDIVQRCANDVDLIDCKSNRVIELAMTELLNSGQIKKHMSRVKKIYAERLKFMCALIEQELGDYTNFPTSSSGFNIWLNIEPTINMQLFLNDASKFGLKLSQTQCFADAKNQVNYLQLGFAHLNKEEMTAGIKQLKNVFRMQIRQKISA